MRNRPLLTFTLLALVAGLGAGGAAHVGIGVLEERLDAQARAVLTEADAWMTLKMDGTILRLTGEAPDFATRTASLRRIGSASAGMTLDDQTQARDVDVVAPTAPAAGVAPAPLADAGNLTLEILRAGPSLTLFGTVPDGPATTAALDALDGLDLAGAPAHLTPLLQTAPGSGPTNWIDSLALGISAVRMFDQSRVAIGPGTLDLTATAPDADTRRDALEKLRAQTPQGVILTATIDVPRPVLSPFVFTARLPAGGGLRVPTCMSETPEGADRIAAAAGSGPVRPDCQIGLGAPSAAWDDAVIAALATLERLGEGGLRVRNSDIMLTGTRNTDPDRFAAEAEALTAALPLGFSLAALLPPDEQPELDDNPTAPRFTAVRTEDGAVRMRGDVLDDVVRETTKTFAEAKFGFDTVVNETAARADLPAGWSVRVVAGLEALGLLATGQLEVTEAQVFVTGTYADEATDEVLRETLASRLPDGATTVLEIWQDEELRVSAAPEVPADLCAEQIALTLEGAQILFPPGKTEIEADSLPVIDRIGEILRSCPGARFEIGGHTDSQGTEAGNLALSKARAGEVLNVLTSMNLDTVFLYAKGYGETQPIGDNGTEDGRAINRRIAFKLVTADEQALATAPMDPVIALVVAPAQPLGDDIGPDAARDGTNLRWPVQEDLVWPGPMSRVSPDGEMRQPVRRDGLPPPARDLVDPMLPQVDAAAEPDTQPDTQPVPVPVAAASAPEPDSEPQPRITLPDGFFRPFSRSSEGI